jgi:hypothetical protein
MIRFSSTFSFGFKKIAEVGRLHKINYQEFTIMDRLEKKYDIDHPAELPNLNATKKKDLFLKMIKKEFISEFDFAWEVAGGRAQARAGFNEKIVQQLKSVANYIPAIGGIAPADLVDMFGSVAIFVANKNRDERISALSHLKLQMDLKKLDILLDTVAREAWRRYESFIVDRLAHESVVTFARIGARRMLEYTSRCGSRSHDLSEIKVDESLLLAGLIEGRSGRWVDELSNTPLKLNTFRENFLHRQVAKEIFAETVYARPGMRHFEIKDSIVSDHLYSRQKPRHKEQVKNLLARARDVLKGDAESYYNFGAVEHEDDGPDPLAGYILMPPRVIRERYDYRDIDLCEVVLVSAIPQEKRLNHLTRQSNRAYVRVHDPVKKIKRLYFIDKTTRKSQLEEIKITAKEFDEFDRAFDKPLVIDKPIILTPKQLGSISAITRHEPRQALSKKLAAELKTATMTQIEIDVETVRKYAHEDRFKPGYPKRLVDYVVYLLRDSGIKPQTVICRADLTGLSLNGLNLSDIDFSGASFSGDLTNTNFDNCYLINTEFKDITSLRNASFRQAHCMYLQARGVNFTGSHLTGADLSYADLTDASIENCHNMLGVTWTGVDFTRLKCADDKQHRKWDGIKKELTESQKLQELKLTQELENQRAAFLNFQATVDERIQNLGAIADLLKKELGEQKDGPLKDLRDQLQQVILKQRAEEESRLLLEQHQQQEIKAVKQVLEEKPDLATVKKLREELKDLQDQLKQKIENPEIAKLRAEFQKNQLMMEARVAGLTDRLIALTTAYETLQNPRKQELAEEAVQIMQVIQAKIADPQLPAIEPEQKLQDQLALYRRQRDELLAIQQPQKPVAQPLGDHRELKLPLFIGRKLLPHYIIKAFHQGRVPKTLQFSVADIELKETKLKGAELKKGGLNEHKKPKIVLIRPNHLPNAAGLFPQDTIYLATAPGEPDILSYAYWAAHAEIRTAVVHKDKVTRDVLPTIPPSKQEVEISKHQAFSLFNKISKHFSYTHQCFIPNSKHWVQVRVQMPADEKFVKEKKLKEFNLIKDRRNNILNTADNNYNQATQDIRQGAQKIATARQAAGVIRDREYNRATFTPAEIDKLKNFLASKSMASVDIREVSISEGEFKTVSEFNIPIAEVTYLDECCVKNIEISHDGKLWIKYYIKTLYDGHDLSKYKSERFPAFNREFTYFKTIDLQTKKCIDTYQYEDTNQRIFHYNIILDSGWLVSVSLDFSNIILWEMDSKATGKPPVTLPLIPNSTLHYDLYVVSEFYPAKCKKIKGHALILSNDNKIHVLLNGKVYVDGNNRKPYTIKTGRETIALGVSEQPMLITSPPVNVVKTISTQSYRLQKHNNLRNFFTLGSDKFAAVTEQQIQIWQLNDKREWELQIIIESDNGHRPYLISLMEMADNLLVAGFSDGMIRLWRLLPSEGEYQFEGELDAISKDEKVIDHTSITCKKIHLGIMSGQQLITYVTGIRNKNNPRRREDIVKIWDITSQFCLATHSTSDGIDLLPNCQVLGQNFLLSLQIGQSKEMRFNLGFINHIKQAGFNLLSKNPSGVPYVALETKSSCELALNDLNAFCKELGINSEIKNNQQLMVTEPYALKFLEAVLGNEPIIQDRLEIKNPADEQIQLLDNKIDELIDQQRRQIRPVPPQPAMALKQGLFAPRPIPQAPVEQKQEIKAEIKETAEIKAFQSFLTDLLTASTESQNFKFNLQRQKENTLIFDFCVKKVLVAPDTSQEKLIDLVEKFQAALTSLGLKHQYEWEIDWPEWRFTVTATPDILDQIVELLHSLTSKYFKPTPGQQAPSLFYNKPKQGVQDQIMPTTIGCLLS